MKPENVKYCKSVPPTRRASADCAPRTCSAAPSELEKACIVLLVGDFWCDASHLKARIFSILQEKGLMDINQHGQMVEVRQNDQAHPQPVAAVVERKIKRPNYEMLQM